MMNIINHLEDFLITCAEVQIVQHLNRVRIHLAKKLTLELVNNTWQYCNNFQRDLHRLTI